jgi:hypothetical protein
MPGQDRTGPLGEGPGTGGGFGLCGATGNRRFLGRRRGMRNSGGRGFGAGRGLRRGGPARFVNTPMDNTLVDEEMELLRKESQELRQALNDANERLQRLEENRNTESRD